ncbi:exodeoxyribonuclease V subunit gamma [Aliidiomarina sanyensis]|uniref:RecBCD enzyme subunit RecC n=1 Tax=Aliidiomarina sanyensis TaxID=1249555 RepID=A0A432WKD0_9GAMM|nr:exodeoxyribonuclease V subunit gamma [Aliidiomarina sanyensis]RUO34224.1 exodeoxyribonuclease V subunit gamma [Aliidiomarina sanyensis]
MNKLDSGFAILHSNQLEVLRDALVQWMASHPLDPLGEEQILVQSNGIAQWLKMALASTENHHPGIAAGLRVELPNQFIWRLYRMILGPDIPASLPYDKNNLTWRILRLLPTLNDPVFTPLQRYLADDSDGRKHWHLAARLADLFDQYQVYRADWLQAWSRAEDVIVRQQLGDTQTVPPEQAWQPALWRALRKDLSEVTAEAAYSSRADVHHRALDALRAGTIAAGPLPDRVIIFGISSLPYQSLELLAALGQHSQVMLAVLNPCRHFWGDIASVQDEVRRQQKRQQRKADLPEAIDPASLHLFAPPLLASLGKQGRDYLSLLDQFDAPEQYQDWFSDRIDLFSEPVADVASLPLLQQLQQDILELEPVPNPKRLLSPEDQSLTFHRAHSRQREVEILQDQLIADFAADPTLTPKDVIVMTPDIGEYAPHVHAVFGRIERDDRRYLPYSLADQANRGRVPLLIALEYLLSLPDQRVTLNDVFDLLEVPAIQRRFDVKPHVLPQLRLWLTESGVRWGLDGNHRETLGIESMGDAFSWIFGLERILLGYAMGGDHGEALDSSLTMWHGRRPYGEVAGLAADDLGSVLRLLRALKVWVEALDMKSERSVLEWTQMFYGRDGQADHQAEVPQSLLEQFFDFQAPEDERLLASLTEALSRVMDAADAGDFRDAVSLPVVRDAWLAEADQQGLSQRFMGGQITFSTLLPMRAIPFRKVYILGLNDGEYPRARRADDFDLMTQEYRPGDRSRRDDDRYLFLEALLSARESLYLSWIGFSDRDKTEKPASVLVNQVRDVIAQGWELAADKKGGVLGDVLAHLTTDYPLQPFSPYYFAPQSALRTYAREWEALTPHAPEAAENLPRLQNVPELTLDSLRRFLNHPVRFFLRERLQGRFFQDDLTLLDDEPFALDGLGRYQVGSELLRDAIKHGASFQLEPRLRVLQAEGRLPLALMGQREQQELGRTIATVQHRIIDSGYTWTAEPTGRQVALEFPLERLPGAQHPNHSRVLQLKTQIDDLFRNQVDELAILLARPGSITEKQQPRWELLLDAMLKQLVANAAGHALRVWHFGLDTAIELPAVPRAQAYETLQGLIQMWWEGLQQPLPLARATAIKALMGAGENQLRDTYEGGYQKKGEVEQSPELGRYYPTFEHLIESGFSDWAERVYGPLLACYRENDGEDMPQAKHEHKGARA